MSEQTTETNKKSAKGKFSIILIIGIAVLGAAITAFMLIQSSDKQTYFTAEKESLEFISDEIEERFQDEIAWQEVTEENPVESDIVLSAEYNDPAPFGSAAEVEEIINNSTVTINAQQDIENKSLFADVSADIAGLTFDDIRLHLTDTDLLVELPFLDDVLQLESEDTGKLLHEADPFAFDEDDNIDFADFFDPESFGISEEDREYLVEHYMSFIYNNLPDSAFSSEKEEVKVDGEEFKAEKVELHLTEDEFKEFLTSMIEEMEEDERLEEIVTSYLENNYVPADELEAMLEDYDEAFDEALEEIDEIELPEGITSTIWVKSGLIVKRDFHLAVVDDFGDEAEISVVGTQMLENKEQFFDYDLNVKDDFMDETVNLSADLSWDGDKIDDTITLDLNEFVLEYQGDETYKDATRDFDRSISFLSPFATGSLVWEGNAEYEKDQMSSSHNFYLDAEEIGEDLLSVQLDVEGKQIKEVDSIDVENVKNIGKMSGIEMDQYIEGEAADQFFEWYMEKFGDLGF